MFNSLGWPELAVMLVVSLFVFGPDRLPGVAAQAGRALRSFRSYARGLRDDLADDLGPEIREVNLRTLQNPRSLVVKHVLGQDEPARDGRSPAARRARAPQQLPPDGVAAAAAPPVPRQPGGPAGPAPTTPEHRGNHG